MHHVPRVVFTFRNCQPTDTGVLQLTLFHSLRQLLGNNSSCICFQEKQRNCPRVHSIFLKNHQASCRLWFDPDDAFWAFEFPNDNWYYRQCCLEGVHPWPTLILCKLYIYIWDL